MLFEIVRPKNCRLGKGFARNRNLKYAGNVFTREGDDNKAEYRCRDLYEGFVFDETLFLGFKQSRKRSSFRIAGTNLSVQIRDTLNINTSSSRIQSTVEEYEILL